MGSMGSWRKVMGTGHTPPPHSYWEAAGPPSQRVLPAEAGER